MNDDCLKLTTYFGERDRANGGFLADAFTDIYGRHELATSLLLRGVLGFGPNQHIRTDRLLTLSEDLPLVSVAVDTRERIEAALGEVNALEFNGLVTLERAHMLAGRITTRPNLPWLQQAETKLTIYAGRQERVSGKPAYEAVVAILRERGIAGATVLLGVDGTAHGVRERAKFFGRNASVPLMVIAVGSMPRIAELVPELCGMLSRPLITLERVRVCKFDRVKLAEPPTCPKATRPAEVSGRSSWSTAASRSMPMAAAPRRAHPRTAPRPGRRGDQPARHLGLPRQSPAPRGLLLAAAASRPHRHRDRRHPGGHPPMVRDRR